MSEREDGFLTLEPRGVPAAEEVYSAKPDLEQATEEQANYIEELRISFLNASGMKSNRPLKYQERLLNKISFSLYMDRSTSPDVFEAILCDRITLFSSAYADRQHNHIVARKSREQRHKTSDGTMRWVLRGCTEEQAVKLGELLFRLDKMARSQKKNLKSCLNELDAVYRKADEDWNLEANVLQGQLQKWLPDDSLSLEESWKIYRCLQEIVKDERDQHLIGKLAGHYRPAYSVGDYRRAQQYAERLAQLKAFRVAAESARVGKISFPFQEDEVFGGGLGTSVQQSAEVQLIHDATKQYFAAVRTTAKKIPIESVAAISTQVMKNSPELFPFRYFVVCTVGSGGLFSRMSEVSYDSIVNFPKQVYRAKPSREKQRLARMLLLDSLCRAMNLTEETRLRNWRLFWWYHGSYLETQEEAALWKTITKGNPVDLPILTYSMYCFQHLNECLSPDPSTLFSYEACSKWHLGGFLGLLDRCRGLDSILCKNHIPAKISSSYLALWSEPLRDREEIRQICKRGISKMNWTGIGEAIGGSEELQSEELQALLTEYAIRLQLIEQAKESLCAVMCAFFEQRF